MLNYASQNDFLLSDEEEVSLWIKNVVNEEEFELGDLSYVFCSDDFLHKMNLEYLDHDTLTDIITFDYRQGKLINGEIYISTDRVEENATKYRESEERRVGKKKKNK